jgi:hypothetical protein
MTWLAWRQLRVQAAAGALALGLLAALLAVATRSDGLTSAGDLIRGLTVTQRQAFSAGNVVLLLAPAIVGVFWGAPLIAREVEAGTHRLVWGQTIGRGRWLWVKLGFAAALTIVVVGLASLAFTWWATPIDETIAKAGGSGGFYVARVEPLAFAARGVVPVAYALFALAAGVTAGLLLRRTVPAMAATLVVVAIAQVATPMAVREHLVPAERQDRVIGERAMIQLGMASPRVVLELPGTWIHSQHAVDRAGRSAELPASFARCVEQGSQRTAESCKSQLRAAGYRQRVVLHPAGSFWRLQWTEAALFTALALALAGFCAWRIRDA